MHRWAAWALAAALIVPPVRGAQAAWDPPGWRKTAPASGEGSTSPAALPLLWGVQFFRTVISPVDGDRCPSSPTCSAYALEAVREHGAVLGFALTAGRLVSEADQPAFAPRVLAGGQWKTYAPVADDLAFLRGRLAP